MTKAEKKRFEPIARDFVKACNVMPLINANEGGVIYTAELLIDFIDYFEENKHKVTG